jgi:hypothetical protein
MALRPPIGLLPFTRAIKQVMATKTKSSAKSRLKRPKKAVPPPGRKLSKAEAREYVFKTHGGALAMLAKQ